MPSKGSSQRVTSGTGWAHFSCQERVLISSVHIAHLDFVDWYLGQSSQKSIPFTGHHWPIAHAKKNYNCTEIYIPAMPGGMTL